MNHWQRRICCLLIPIVLSGCSIAGLAPGLSPAQQAQLQRVATALPPPGEPVFHVIGLYRGWPPPGMSLGNMGFCKRLADPECQRILQHQVEHDVRVRVTDTQHPVILGLSAYERTHWHLDLAPGVELQRVIVSGQYPQRLTGAGASAAVVDVYINEVPFCQAGECTRAKGFYDFQAPAQRYQVLVDQAPTSFLGAQEKGWVEIGPDRVGIYPR